MRVLVTTDTVGGVWDHACTLARRVHDEGHAVLLAVIGERPDARLAALPGGVEVVARPYRLEWMRAAEEEVREAGEWLAHLARVWEADVVHLNQYAYAVADFHAPTLVAAHSDVRSWFSEALGTPAPADWDGYGRWVAAGLGAASVVVAPSAYQSALLERHYGRPADRVIHNGVDAPPPAAPPEPAAPLVVLAGRAWDAAKGAEVLDAAVGLLGSAAPPAHLLGSTTGPGGERFYPRHLTAHGRVEREEVDAWLRRASLYAAPSLYEPFGLAPLEAALHGCALVLSDIGSFRELWDGCADFFPPGDARTLADLLARLAADPARRASLATAAHRRALRRYSAARMAAEYLSLYRELALRPARSPVASGA